VTPMNTINFSRKRAQRAQNAIQPRMGEKYQIESSTNLQTWSTNSTVTNLTGQIEVKDTFAPNQPRKFYRAVLVK
jgi:hypothetical protein